MNALPKLGILAGGGILPGRLIEACRASGRDYFVVAWHGHADPAVVGDVPQLWARLTEAGTVVDTLRRNAVTELVMAGHVRRPAWSEFKSIDRRTAKFLGNVGLKALGDDGLLRAITRQLESEGFRVVGPDDVINDLKAPEGQYGRVAPDPEAKLDIERGIEVARALGAIDVGHAVVVRQGTVLGVETIEGTGAMIARCGDLDRDGPGGVLVKVCKPQQDRRLDLPVIGPDTVAQVDAAGLKGIAVEAGATLVVDRKAVIDAADRNGTFVIGIVVPW